MLNKLLSWQGLLDFIWLIFLLFMLRYFYSERQILSKAKSWLITKGKITRLEWVSEGTRLWPQIEYQYQVFDQNFTGEYFFLDTSHNNANSKYARRIAYRAAMAYEDNREVDVYYNPDYPEQAVLDISMPSKLTLIIALLIGLILLHLAVVIIRLL